MKLYWLEKSGLQVEDDDDLLAVLAKRAIQTRKIELRVFDPVLAQTRLGISGDLGLRDLPCKVTRQGRSAINVRLCILASTRLWRLLPLQSRPGIQKRRRVDLAGMLASRQKHPQRVASRR